MKSVAKDAAVRRGYAAVVVSTAHEVFKERALFEGLPLVVDTRNLVAGLFPDGGGPRRVVKA
jgi:UDP-N-acetyl-D-glucosamine dehydrogenase